MPGVTVGRQVFQFIVTCGLGFLLGLYYECFKAIRMWSPPGVVACVFQDIFFCLSSAVITFFAFLGLADGNMYPYLFVGEAVGFFVFYGSLGNVVHKILVCFLKLCNTIFNSIQKRVWVPVYGWFIKKISRKKSALVKKSKKTRKTQKKSIFFSKNP